MRLVCTVVLSFVVVVPGWGQSKPTARLTDTQVKEQNVKASIAAYAGSCPCPFNRDRAGRSCGRRSAYSRPGGKAPLCYVDDVTAKMVTDYRARTDKLAGSGKQK